MEKYQPRDRSSRKLKVGALVRLLAVPPLVESRPDKEELNTKQVFRQSVGHVFRVRGIGTNSTPGARTNHIELWVSRGSDCDDVAKADTIWVEPEYIEPVNESRT